MEHDEIERVSCNVDHSTETYAVRMVGSSMEPRYRHGDIIYIDPLERPAHGSGVMAIVNGSPVIRTYEEESDGVYLLAENPEHPARKVRMSEGDKVIGRVIYVGRPE